MSLETLVSSLIGLGIFSVLAYLVRGQGEIRADVREIKTTLGTNGHADQGLVAEVKRLRERSHAHAQDLTILMTERELRREGS